MGHSDSGKTLITYFRQKLIKEKVLKTADNNNQCMKK